MPKGGMPKRTDDGDGSKTADEIAAEEQKCQQGFGSPSAQHALSALWARRGERVEHGVAAPDALELQLLVAAHEGDPGGKAPLGRDRDWRRRVRRDRKSVV